MPRFTTAPRPARTAQVPFDVFLAIDERGALRRFPREVLETALEVAHESGLEHARVEVERELIARRPHSQG